MAICESTASLLSVSSVKGEYCDNTSEREARAPRGQWWTLPSGERMAYGWVQAHDPSLTHETRKFDA